MQQNMIYNVSDIVITYTTEINDTINKNIETFLKAMCAKSQSVSYYAKKRNVREEKAKNDIFLGKKAEYFTRSALIEHYGFPYINIDLEVRQGRKKGWNTDLPFKAVDDSLPDIHVKSCSKKTLDFCKDYSWTFQNKNNDKKGGTDTILDTSGKQELIALVYIEEPYSATGVIKAILPFDIIKKMLKPPLKPTLKNLKKCLYYKDLIKKEDKLWQDQKKTK
jgi:hypothetical protein